jgi:hypothetical protein
MIGIGDVLCVRGTDWAARLIRLGAALLDEPNLDNHVAIVHHQDASGTWWAVEGRPGGVGWADAANYLKSPWTVNNGAQAKTDAQRTQVAHVAEGVLGAPYDWTGIVADAMEAIHAPDFWAQNWEGQGPPAHFVCSSLAAWVYENVGLARPTFHEPRLTTPADWDQFIVTGGYNAAAAAATTPPLAAT